MTESKSQRLELSKLESEVFTSTGAVTKSFYLGLDPAHSKISNVGDVLSRHGDKWTFIGSLTGRNALISNPLMKKRIQEVVNEVDVGTPTSVTLEKGVTLECSLDGQPGDFSQLPESITSLKVVANAEADAYIIKCGGAWHSLRDPKKLEEGLKDIRASEKLSIFIRNDLVDYVLVTEVFKTSSNFTALTVGDIPLKLEFEINQTPPISSNDAYKQLSDEIKKGSPHDLKASVDPVVPFVRLRKLQPLWLLNDELQEKVVYIGNDARGLPTLGRDKVVKPPDDIHMSMLEPKVKR